jgi:hypothetical protein
MKYVFALILCVCASAVVAEDAKVAVPLDTTDAKSARELGEQVHKIKKNARTEKASAFRRFKASKLEGKAKGIRGENEKALKELTGK